MFLKYCRVLIEYLQKQPFFIDQIAESLKEISGKQESKIDIYNAVLSAHIFDPNAQGITPFDFFLTHAKLRTDQKKMYQFWKKSNFFSLFEIVEVGREILASDIVSAKPYLISVFEQTKDVEIGALLMARLVPVDKEKTRWAAITGNVLEYPREGIEILKRELGKGGYERLNELELVKYIYTQEK